MDERATTKMFCFQCEQTAKGTGCTIQGVCGKSAEVANLQDLLIYQQKGIAAYQKQLMDLKAPWADAALPLCHYFE